LKFRHLLLLAALILISIFVMPGSNTIVQSSTVQQPAVVHDNAAATLAVSGFSTALKSGWLLQSSAKVSQAGNVISTGGYQPQGWYPITAPASVIAGLLQNNVYPDPYFGTNFQLINAADFSVPWWYRNTFTLPSSEAGKRVWIKFNGLS